MDDHSEAKRRVLDAAEKLFMERGYTAVTLRDIAQALNIKQASLYYHVAGGKEALFVEVVERNLARHRAGLCTALAQAEAPLRAKLLAVAEWLFSQPPLDLGRMIHSDLPALSPAQAQRLERSFHEALLQPLEEAFAQAQATGEIRPAQVSLLSGMLLTMLEAAHSLPTHFRALPKQRLAAEMIDILLDGLRLRAGL
ncbi:MAG: TetR/AcrR family transcriptional regulator [Candidatus Thermofonsia Clade 1 bacterium]|jgi:AcrR family transcriptional regulator|uniref:TetR/AcrR family transcriptional regulator n=1 Tax=Candidatus Thermofonsia Clade 1 bacterium TaxID=2364210 RepID=A0A2M8PE31_9CHLR|nr:MAG: TetR/AcrR family transcriptional regulator [Candidatus Thermofonsia Clade 1 bacterium]RMF51700.1 MAG: TetR family transcriptional regulator [Chloroflexota bacterium]